MYTHLIKIVFVLALLFTSTGFADQNKNDRMLFEGIFTVWTDAFNHKNLAGSCRLFAKSVTADYQGVPQKNYAAICGGFKKIFKEPHRQYRYTFKLHQVYRSGNLATVRITWYLRLDEKGKKTIVTQDEGLDVLQRNSQGEWQIVNYVGYESKS
ncbi:MAG: YybH family protein [Gammaproteobacteria bacterium]